MQEAVTLLQRCIKIRTRERSWNHASLGAPLLYLALSHERQGEWEAAQGAASRMTDLADLNDPLLLAKGLFLRGRVAVHVSQADSARQLLHRSAVVRALYRGLHWMCPCCECLALEVLALC